MQYATIAVITDSRTIHSGLVFDMLTQDERQRKLSYGLAIVSSMPQARRLANAKFAQLMFACDKVQLTDTEQLHGKQVIVEYRLDAEDRANVVRVEPMFKPVTRIEYLKATHVGWFRMILNRFKA